jgi:hypothetical protein
MDSSQSDATCKLKFEVSFPSAISTKGIRTGGFIKCIPRNLDGFTTASCNSRIEREDVHDAISALAF